MKKLNYKIIATGDVKLRLVDRPTLKISDKQKQVIEKTWQGLLRKNSKLFSDALLNFATLDIKGSKINIGGDFVEYKQFLANREQPELKLNIKPIGVSGMIIIREGGTDYVVWAKRAGGVANYPNFFELVPSGSIDKEFVLANGDVDYKSKLLSEFSEETGLPKNYVKEVLGFALVLDTAKNIYDICCIISVNKKRLPMEKYFHKSEEYKNFRFVPLKDLDIFIKDRTDSIVPSSMALIRAYTKLKKNSI